MKHIQENHPDSISAASLQSEKLGEKRGWLGASDDLFQTLLSISPFGVYISQKERFLMTSQTLTQMTGFSANELSKMGPLDIVFSEDQESFRKKVREMLNGFRSSPFKIRLKTKKGETKWALGTVSSVTYKGTSSVIGSLVDITGYKRISQSLQKQSFLFKKLCISLRDGLIIMNHEGKITFWNPAAEKMFGYTIKEALGQDLHKLIAFDLDTPVYREGLSTFEKTGKGPNIGKIIPLLAKRKDGTTFPVELTVSSLNLDRKQYAIGIIRDTTRQVLAENSLRENEDKFRIIVECSPDAILITTLREGRILFVNPAFCTLTRYAPSDVIGKTVYELSLYTHINKRKSIVGRLKTHGSLKEFQAQFNKKDGKPIEILLSSSLLEFRGEKCILTIAKDITDLKEAQHEKKRLYEQLLHSQKMEAVGTLSSGISHDFNNMLQAILGYAELLLVKKTPRDPDTSKLQQIIDTAQKASELTQQLLRFSRKTENRKKVVDINQAVTHARKLLKRTLPKSIEIELQLDPHTLPIYASLTQIEQVLLNLAINAKDAMPNGGKLTFKTENLYLNEKRAKVLSESLKSGNYVLLNVSDTGTGMGKETLQRIFEPFFTTKGTGKGTGLGLSMVYGIVKEHRGHILCESSPGEGTIFRIYLPMADNQMAGQKREGKPENLVVSKESHNKNILFIDDEVVLQNLCRELLINEGYKVLTASDCLEGLTLYKENKNKIALVIMDFMMPKMEGSECMKKFLEINPNEKIIIASGYSIANGHIKDLLERCHTCAFIRKPYGGIQLLQTIKNMLEHAPVRLKVK